jgi:23S rRNA pseudoU1915 N3-methylase RlmH
VRSFRVDFLREGPWRLPGVKALAEHYERQLVKWLRWSAAILPKKNYERGIRERASGKKLLLLDEKGTSWSTSQWTGAFEDALLKEKGWVIALGPPDGWSESFKSEGFLLSLGPATLPHDLAGVILIEQIYRVCSRIKGHPYHRAP